MLYSAVSANPVYKVGRKALVRTFGGDLLVTPEQAIDIYTEIIRKIISNEDILLLVRGPMGALDSSGTRSGYEKAERRRFQVHRALGTLCGQLRVPYIGWDEAPIGYKQREMMLSDELHETPEFHAGEAKFEGDALVSAWRAAHPEG